MKTYRVLYREDGKWMTYDSGCSLQYALDIVHWLKRDGYTVKIENNEGDIV